MHEKYPIGKTPLFDFIKAQNEANAEPLPPAKRMTRKRLFGVMAAFAAAATVHELPRELDTISYFNARPEINRAHPA